MPLPINLEDLGRRIRTIRLSRQLTLEEVVARAEFTVSWLSKLENGQLTPSLEGLVKLSDVLDCRLEELVEGLSVKPKHVFVRDGQGRIETTKDRGVDVALEHLAESWRGRTMHPVILHLAAGTCRPPGNCHSGERFFMVLEGTVRLEYGSDVLVLSEGDSVYIDATPPHSLSVSGRAKARVLCMSFDPSNSNGRHRDSTPRMNSAHAGRRQRSQR